ncbi:MAG TPA: hypothetical protein GX733_04440 [Tissierellia bacterium]|nr:hypothetical protein [Tissierellia bacterium]
MDKFNELDSQKAHLLRVLEDLKLKEKKNCYSRDQVLEFFFQYTNLQVVEKNAEGCAPNA